MRNAIDMLSRLLGLCSGVCIAALIALTIADVAWRNLQGQSVPGVYEYSEVILVATVFLSLAWTQKINGHVSIDLFVDMLPARASHWVQAIGLAIALAVLCWMLTASARTAWHSLLSGEYRFGLAQVPVWPARVTVTVGVAMLVLQVALSLFDNLRWALGAQSLPAPRKQTS